jgi:hypothetical protein
MQSGGCSAMRLKLDLAELWFAFSVFGLTELANTSCHINGAALANVLPIENGVA